jgi:hypothetical protein
MSDTSGFGKFLPGFEFLQSLAGQASGAAVPGMGGAPSALPNLGNWVAPTFNVEDLEKRIDELKAVQFWLDQNAKALAATIQALEVQKMTLATLRTMNFSLGDVADALKVKPAPGPVTPSRFEGLEIPPHTHGGPAATAPAAGPKKTRAKAASRVPKPGEPQEGVIDPVQWWGALSQQFQQIAATALQNAARPDATAAASPSPAARKAAAAAVPRAAARKPARRR